MAVAAGVRGGSERVAPHLEDPAETRVSSPIELERQAHIQPFGRQPRQCWPVDDQRRRPHRLDVAIRRAGDELVDDRLVARTAVHVAEAEGGGLLLRRQVGQRAHQHVVCLRDVHVCLCQRRHSAALDPLHHRIRPVEDPEVAIAMDLGGGVLDDEGGGHLALETVGFAALRRHQAREAAHLRARAVPRLLLLPVVVHDARLPLLVHSRLRREQRVVRLAAGTTLRRRRAVARTGQTASGRRRSARGGGRCCGSGSADSAASGVSRGSCSELSSRWKIVHIRDASHYGGGLRRPARDDAVGGGRAANHRLCHLRIMLPAHPVPADQGSEVEDAEEQPAHAGGMCRARVGCHRTAVAAPSCQPASGVRACGVIEVCV